MKKLAALLAVSAIALTGCSASATDGGGTGRLQVVASTDVYGDIVKKIAGDRVEITSIIADSAKDPHSYEASARDRLAVQKADLIIENGGGYDAFMDTLREGSKATVITAAEFSHDYPGEGHADDGDSQVDEHDHGHEGHDHIEGFNEHVWFDVHTMSHVAEQIAKDLTSLDPAGKSDYQKASEKLIGELDGFQKQLDDLHGTLEGTKVIITEPLPGLLAAAAGLDDVTPDGFAAAVEEGNDVAPATLLATTRLIASGEVKAVLTTAQTGGSETQKVEQAAKDAGIPVLKFSELLGPDQSYAEWMREAIDSLSGALQR